MSVLYTPMNPSTSRPLTRREQNRKVYHWSLNKEELQVLIEHKDQYNFRTLNEALQHLLTQTTR